MKKISLLFFVLFTSVFYCQSIQLNVQNDSINNKILFKTLDNKVLKTVYVKDANFDADLDVEEGYYLLQKDTNELLLYLKRSDELTISFDTENFYNSVIFTGKGAERNTYLLNKKLDLVDRRGRLRNFYKKEFYNGEENEYLNKLDTYYKNFFGSLFSNGYDKSFVDEEMKNLQYGYSLDLLKFEEAKKYYQFNDSVAVSTNFLEPLNFTHFDKSELAKRYDSYKKLAVLKWRKDIQNTTNIKMMQDVYNSIRTESIQQGVLESLYNEMSRKNPNTKDYFNLIKANTDDFLLIAKAKAKYNEIRRFEAEKNLSKFTYKTF